MQKVSQQMLYVLFRRTPYADTFRYIKTFKTKQIGFQDIFYNLDHILYSSNCCEWVFYIRDFIIEHIALFHLPIAAGNTQHATTKIFETKISTAGNTKNI